MDTATLIATVSSVLFIGGSLAAGLRWILKHYLSELKPNHGTSLNDKIVLEVLPMIKELKQDMGEVKADIKDVKVDVVNVKTDLAHLQGRFEQYVEQEF